MVTAAGIGTEGTGKVVSSLAGGTCSCCLHYRGPCVQKSIKLTACQRAEYYLSDVLSDGYLLAEHLLLFIYLNLVSIISFFSPLTECILNSHLVL